MIRWLIGVLVVAAIGGAFAAAVYVDRAQTPAPAATTVTAVPACTEWTAVTRMRPERTGRTTPLGWDEYSQVPVPAGEKCVR